MNPCASSRLWFAGVLLLAGTGVWGSPPWYYGASGAHAQSLDDGLPALPTPPAVPCHTLDASHPVPEGFGAAYDALSPAHELLLAATCTDPGATIAVGTGLATQYVHRYAYEWRDDQWRRVELSGSTPPGTPGTSGRRRRRSRAPRRSSRGPTPSSRTSAPGPGRGGGAAAATTPAPRRTGSCRGSPTRGRRSPPEEPPGPDDGGGTGPDDGGGTGDRIPPLGVYMDTLPDGTRSVTAQQAIDHFQPLTGMPVTLFETFAFKSGWSSIEARDDRFAGFADWLRRNPDRGLVLSLPPFPTTEGSGATPLGKCANGAFNAHYETFARRMRDVYRIDRLIIRFGWEWNGGWYPWGVGGNTDRGRLFGQCFRQFVQTVDRAYPGHRFIFDWNPTHDTSLALLNAAWPGDDVVDLVGTDTYDVFWGEEPCRSDPACRWSRRVGPALERFRSFAAAHDKPMSIPEWGVWNTSDERSGGDNPYYVRRMCEFILDPANRVAYSVYFEDNGGGDHFLYHPKNTQSLAAFRQHCDGASTAKLGLGLDDGR